MDAKLVQGLRLIESGHYHGLGDAWLKRTGGSAAAEIEALRSTIRALSKGDIMPISDKDAKIERMTAAINRALPLLAVSNCPSEAEDLLKSALADEQ